MWLKYCYQIVTETLGGEMVANWWLSRHLLNICRRILAPKFQIRAKKKTEKKGTNLVLVAVSLPPPASLPLSSLFSPSPFSLLPSSPLSCLSLPPPTGRCRPPSWPLAWATVRYLSLPSLNYHWLFDRIWVNFWCYILILENYWKLLKNICWMGYLATGGDHLMLISYEDNC